MLCNFAESLMMNENLDLRGKMTASGILVRGVKT